MGELRVGEGTSPERRRAFTRGVLADLRALEILLETERISRGPMHIGAEQEMFLIDAQAHALGVGPELVADAADDPRLTGELARFNLEANLPPTRVAGECLDVLRRELTDVMENVARRAALHGARPILAGILPTLHGDDLRLTNMTPAPRYRELNANLIGSRGGAMQVFIRGIDELHREQRDVMLEAANASFQLHLQIDPARFASLYNLAQLVSAPLLAVSTASPVLLGRRLWHETRVALFELATDDRSVPQRARGHRPRVGFGDGWARGTIPDLYRADIAAFPVLLTCDLDPDPVGAVEAGETPRLRALNLHNGTVWRWNRICYGSNGESAHIRIENRVLPAGPTIADEVANAALFFGLMHAPNRFGDVAARMSFDFARAGLIHAARSGVDATLPWLDGTRRQVPALFKEDLLPAATEGLWRMGLSESAAEEVLAPIRGRVEVERTASGWILDAYSRLCERYTPERASQELTEALFERQQSGVPTHEWAPYALQRHRGVPVQARHVMRPAQHSVRPSDPVELAAMILDWSKEPYLPVESDDGRVVGLLTGADTEVVAERVADVMNDARVVEADAPLGEIERELEDASCLLVVSDDRLVGQIDQEQLQRWGT